MSLLIAKGGGWFANCKKKSFLKIEYCPLQKKTHGLAYMYHVCHLEFCEAYYI